MGGVEFVHHAGDQRVWVRRGNYVWIRWTTDGRILEKDLGKSGVEIDGQERKGKKFYVGLGLWVVLGLRQCAASFMSCWINWSVKLNKFGACMPLYALSLVFFFLSSN